MPLICSLHSLPLKWLPLPSRKLRLFDCFPCCDPLGGKVAALQKRKNKTQKTVNVNDNFFFFLNTVGVIYVTWHIVSTVRNSCWRSLKILGKWGFSWRTLKRRREINLGPPRSVPYVTLHQGDLQPFLPINGILMTKKATHQPHQFTVICRFTTVKFSVYSGLTAARDSHRPIFCSWDLFYSQLVMVHCTKCRQWLLVFFHNGGDD